jgi:ATP-dependent RNA helicase RhlE
MPFRALGLEAKVLRAVTEAGYTEPTPIQSAAIPPIIAGQDLIGIAQTGTGKTAAFTLPILTKLASQPGQPGQRRGTKVLVIAPTRELAVQIDENVRTYAKHLPLTVATVFGGVGEQPQIRALRAGTDIIVATAGRLLDLMRQRCADFSQLKFLVLDEADRMLDMGFLPDITSIILQLPKQRQTLMFSATLSKEIEALTHKFQQNPKLIQIGRRANPAETVTQLIYEIPQHLKTSLLLHLLQSPEMDMVLVFSRMKHNADRIARQLESKGVRCATLHSNRSQNQRLRALKDFKDGVVRVLVATDIAARGIDVDGISHVVNYDFPMQPEDYVHRIGRTGRAQAIGDAISFVTSQDHGDLRAVERFIGRGIVRKKAEGFNYSQKAEPFNPVEEPRDFRHGQNRPPQSGRPQRSDGPQRPFGQGGQSRPQYSDRPPRPGGRDDQQRPQRPSSYGETSRPPRQPDRPQRSDGPRGYGGQNRPHSYGEPQRPQRSGHPWRQRGNDGQNRPRPPGGQGGEQRPQYSDRPQRPPIPGGQSHPQQSDGAQRQARQDRLNRLGGQDEQRRPKPSGQPQPQRGHGGQDRPQPANRPPRPGGYGGPKRQNQQKRSSPPRWRR